ncbi:hypothetical protein ACVIHH_008495 [Bradyrhizobium sp. USDA 4518]
MGETKSELDRVAMTAGRRFVGGIADGVDAPDGIDCAKMWVFKPGKEDVRGRG